MRKYTILVILNLGFWGVIHAQAPQKTTYTYDALNRLTEVTHPNGSKVTYNYDVLGNRTSVVQTATCQAPTSFNPAITATNSATLSWGAVSGATGYRIRYRPPSFTTWPAPNSFSVVSPTAVINGWSMGADCDYQVETLCSGGTASGYSATQSFTTTCLTPTATLSGSQTITAGQTATLTAAVTGGNPLYPNYLLRLNNGQQYIFNN